MSGRRFQSRRPSRPRPLAARRARSRSKPANGTSRPSEVGGPSIAATSGSRSTTASSLRLPSQTEQRAAERVVEPSQPPAFQGEHRAQERIDRRRRHGDLLLCLLFLCEPAPPLQGPNHKHRQEERRVGVGEPDNLESRAGEQTLEGPAMVPSDFAAQDRMIAAKRRHRRDIDDGKPAGARDAVHFRNGGTLVRPLQRVQNVKRGDNVEYPAGKRRGSNRRAYEPGPARLATEAEAGLRNVEPVGAAEAPEELQVGSGAAPTAPNATPPYITPCLVD